jgi:hypothetical protein
MEVGHEENTPSQYLEYIDRGSVTPETFTLAPTLAPIAVTVESTNMVVVGFLIGLIILLSILFLIMSAPPIMRYIQRRREADPKRIELRYATIEKWLISKRVLAHSENCEIFSCTRSHETKGSNNHLKPMDSCDTVETDDESSCRVGRECPICMEEFLVDDVVSWSPCLQGTCSHVFHHRCIKKWLLRHSNCPFCRETFLPVDAETYKSAKKKQTAELTKQRRARSAVSYYCARDGLVTIDEDRYSSEMVDMCREIVMSHVSREELRFWRCTNFGSAMKECSHQTLSQHTTHAHTRTTHAESLEIGSDVRSEDLEEGLHQSPTLAVIPFL